jgi:SNF2 family DNA or RNA helicase
VVPLFSVRLKGDFLDIRFETYLSPREYALTSQIFEGMKGSFFHEPTNSWRIPKEFVDDINDAFTDKVAWYTSINEIKGIREVILPKFTVYSEGLEDLKLQPYPFQVVGASFFHDLMQGLLADEMGLGKSLQSIAATHLLWKEGHVHKALVICPSSLKYQWANEIEKFTDHKAVVIDGTPSGRKKQLLQWFEGDEFLFAVINYELVRNDLELIKAIPVDVIIADEVHKIKNHLTKTSIALKQLRSKYKFGMTGTPVQNKPEELYNIMDFLNPTILGNFWAFRNRYVVTGEKFGQKNVVIGYKNLDELRKRVSPYMLRRMKKDVAPELPDITISDYPVEMTSEQRRISEAMSEDLLELLKEITEWRKSQPAGAQDGSDGEVKHPKEGQQMGYFTMMLEVCDSPQLLLMSDANMPKRYAEGIDASNVRSPKLDEIYDLCTDLIDSGNNKIMIFTQFTSMQKLVVDRLSKIGKCEIINGSMKPFERQASLDRHKYDEEINFLVCTDAANYGLNAQHCSVLIHVDQPWNPATYDQRNGRIHRIGSAFKEVNIINLITRGGIDERIQEVLYKKREFSNQLVEKNADERAELGRLNSNVMKSLLKQPAKRGRKKKEEEVE